jgi:SAM-dependent methyltransferase
MNAYGSELALRAPSAVARTALRLLGSYDLGARVRFAALERALRALPPPRSILDVGCGSGHLCFALARRWPGAEVLGVDIDRGRLGTARELAGDAFAGRVRFAHVDERERDGFDLVTCVDVLEHVDDDAGFVAGLAAATAPGGTLVLHVPAARKRRWFAEFPEQADHVRPGYERDSLGALLRTAGYDRVATRATFGAPGAIAWEGFALARRGSLGYRAALPLWFSLAALETRTTPRRGNGVLAVAGKDSRS